ncbi:MAG: hypothetical protein ACI93N_000854 [Flavobacteriaceae bacterium]|jgi:hypothetical protein
MPHLKNFNLVKTCMFFTLFLYISIILMSLFNFSEIHLLNELIYNAIFTIIFGFVFYLAFVFLDGIKKNVLKETILKKDIISSLMQQIVTICLFFAITAFLLNKGLDYIITFDHIIDQVPSLLFFSNEHYLRKNYILVGIILFNYLIIFCFIHFYINKKDLKIDYGGFLTSLEDKKNSKQLSNNKQLSIYGLGKNEVVHMDSDDFIFAKSDGHYIHIYYFVERNNVGNKRVRSILVRNSLKTLITEIFADFRYIARVHKSYVANYNYVKQVRNLPNNKGGIITMNFVNVNIPIGATKINNVNTYLLLNNTETPIYN